MPRRHKIPSKQIQTMMLNCSFEVQCSAWFMQAGWQVFVPLLDCGHKTDLIVSDGPNYYRIQIKTLATASLTTEVQNLWKGSDIDYIVYIAKSSNRWGFICPAFSTNKKKLKDAGGERFEHNKTSFMKAFHSLQ